MPSAATWSFSNWCTDSAIDFCTSRVHRMRSGLARPRASSMRAIDHDFALSRPPYKTLKRALGTSVAVALRGSSISRAAIDSPDHDLFDLDGRIVLSASDDRLR